MCWRYLRLLAVSFIVTACSVCSGLSSRGKDVSPKAFGLKKAHTGIERYYVLLRTHQAAVAKGVNVNYRGIKRIDIEIPKDFVQIPLTRVNDFRGCTINIKNTARKVWLFGTEQKDTPVRVEKIFIDSGSFETIPLLNKGKILLLVEDANPWVDNRRGYSYGHTRKDILLLENGVAQNAPVMPYDNVSSNPKCSFILANEKPLEIKNLTINRDPSCTFVTYLFYVSGYNDVRISGININTPQNTLSDDSAIRVFNSTNVSLTDVTIDGTYSQRDRSGYGISLGNIWNFKASRLYAKGNSGVFGSNNVNVALLEDCEINRFDIHCYGRDVTFRRVSFTDLHNQYSSVFGTILHEGCTFTDFVPISIETSYNAYVRFNARFIDCIFNAGEKKNYLIGAGYVNNKGNNRPELSQKCWPNVFINKLTINMGKGQDKFIVIKNVTEGRSQAKLGYISEIIVDGLTINAPDTPFRQLLISNNKLTSINDIECEINNVIVNNPSLDTKALTPAGNQSVSVIMNLPIKGKNIRMSSASQLKQE